MRLTAPLTVRLPSVPTEVSDDPVMPDGRELPVNPDAGIAVAVIAPLPDVPRDAPEPTNIAADVLVPLVRLLNDPPLPLLAAVICPSELTVIFALV